MLIVHVFFGSDVTFKSPLPYPVISKECVPWPIFGNVTFFKQRYGMHFYILISSFSWRFCLKLTSRLHKLTQTLCG